MMIRSSHASELREELIGSVFNGPNIEVVVLRSKRKEK
jgi:hypothetical protein